MTTGTIKKVVADRGFGFIAAEDAKEYFFHRGGLDSSLDFDRLVGGASLATRTATDSGPTIAGASLAVAISCVGRRIVLGDRTEEEVEAVRDALPENAQVTGFYSYGEISPYATGHCDLHNQTMTLTIFSESETPLPRREGAARAAMPTRAEPPVRYPDRGPLR